MDTVKVYVGEDKSATIRCSHCGRKKVMDVCDASTLNKGLSVKCTCGNCFSVCFETRKFYRKDVALSGEYLKGEGDKWDACDMSVGDMRCGNMALQNIGLGGLAFVTNQRNDLKVGDIVQVKFRLDDAQKSLIVRNAIVRSIDGRQVRAEFCDNQPDKALAFYLMP
jgi:hypothetical protein